MNTVSLTDIKTLYDEGLTNAEIARKLGITRQSVGQKLKQMGLTRNSKVVTQNKSYEICKQHDAEIREYATEFNIKQIAEKIGVSSEIMSTYLRDNGISTTWRSKPNKNSKVDENVIRELLKTKTPSDIAKQLNIHVNSVYYQAHKIQGDNGVRHRTTNQISTETLSNLHSCGYTDKEMADEMKCSVATIRNYRRSLGLNPNYKAKINATK